MVLGAPRRVFGLAQMFLYKGLLVAREMNGNLPFLHGNALVLLPGCATSGIKWV